MVQYSCMSKPTTTEITYIKKNQSIFQAFNTYLQWNCVPWTFNFESSQPITRRASEIALSQLRHTLNFEVKQKNWLTKCSFESIEALSHAIPQISHGKKSFCLKSTTPRTIIWNDKVLIRRFFESSSCKKQLPSSPCQTTRPIIHPKVLHNNNVM